MQRQQIPPRSALFLTRCVRLRPPLILPFLCTHPEGGGGGGVWLALTLHVLMRTLTETHVRFVCVYTGERTDLLMGARLQDVTVENSLLSV